ncbi:NAD(P)/FAD-dependent oxidoreductase [Tamilnaduibacter salinus]|nr:FAD-dependent oxidoreductase [Tamilnaduibacter salinus]
MKTRRLLVIGHGMVAQRLLETLVASADCPYDRIDVVSAESVPAYNRILLSSVLAGDASLDGITLKPDDWFRTSGIHRHAGDPVSVIDPAGKTATTASGQTLVWDDLVIATGSRASRLNLPGEDLAGVYTFRDIDDTEQLVALSQHHRRAVVIGGGFLGLEAAEGLRQRGMAVTVVHRNPWLLNRQLDPTASGLLHQALRHRGMSLETGQSPTAILGGRRARAVQFADDTVISTDLVVIATGITPNRELGADAGLACDRGILVDDRLRTSHPDVYALGECCQLGQDTFGLVEPGYQQADALARHLCGADARFQPGDVATRLKISGIPIFSCGLNQPDEDTESIVWHDRDTDRYCHLLLRANRLAGAVLYGETRDGPWYHDQLTQQNDLTSIRQQLAFGAAHCDV